MLNYLPAMWGYITHCIDSSIETLFWQDQWLNGWASIFLWPKAFRESRHQLLCLGLLLSWKMQILVPLGIVSLPVGWIAEIGKWWSLTASGTFSVKTFYNFLIDGGMRCPIDSWFWRSNCPRKINLFNWLVWKNKMLSLKNLELQRCNKLSTATCVMCHTGIEIADHLFLLCPFAKHVWSNLFGYSTCLNLLIPCVMFGDLDEPV